MAISAVVCCIRKRVFSFIIVGQWILIRRVTKEAGPLR
jgi:hypothetical protein